MPYWQGVVMSRPLFLNTSSLPLCGSRLIEASAGTGKTYTIAMLYLRLILGHEPSDKSKLPSDLTPKDILVVTFTEAATKELNDRIRRRLAQALEVFDPINPLSHEQEQQYVDLIDFRDKYYPQVTQWSTCQKKLILALELMDEAAISTIHSWCYRMLNEHAFDSGSLFEQSLRQDDSLLFKEAIRDYWRIFVYPLAPEHLHLLHYHFPTLEKLEDIVKYNYRHAEHLRSNIESLRSLDAQLITNIIALRNTDWMLVIDEADDFLQKIKNREFSCIKQMHGATVNAIKRALSTLKAWSKSHDLFPLNYAKSKLRGLSRDNLSEYLEPSDFKDLAIVDLITRLDDYLAALGHVKIDIIAHACIWVHGRVSESKAKASELGFDELIKNLHHALVNDSSGVLKNTIASQFPAVLIDEFQDTDNLQYEIFDALYQLAENDLSKCLLLIGDPKQAIYSFRGGDIYTYLKASKAVAEQRYTLDKNYRSSHELVEAVNYLFTTAEREQSNGAFAIEHNDEKLLPFEGVKANGLHQEVVCTDQVQRGLYVQTNSADINYNVDEVAHCVASQIVKLLNDSKQESAYFFDKSNNNKRAILASDIAILVNNKTEAQRLKLALQQRQLRSYYVSDKGSILSSIEAKELFICLQAIAQPKQVVLLRTALACTILHKTIDELYQNVADDLVLDNLFEEFSSLKETWQKQGIFAMLRSFIDKFNIASQLLASNHPQERVLTNILHIAELLQEASLQIDGINNLLNYYEELLTSNEESNEFLLPRLESEKGLVQIVTFHKSKGLQYPIVFIPYATAAPKKPSNNDVIIWHNEKLERVFSLSPSAKQLAQAESEMLAERIRTLYVALTRAQYITIVGLASPNSWYKSALAYLLSLGSRDKDSINELVSQSTKDCPFIKVEVFPTITNDTYLATKEESLASARAIKRKVSAKWQFYSYSSIEYTHSLLTSDHAQASVLDLNTASLDKTQRHFVEQDIENSTNLLSASEDAQLTIHNFYKGANAGTFLHNILEWACLQSFAELVKTPDLLYQHIAQQSELQGWSQYNDVLHKWMLQVISQKLSIAGSDEAIEFSLASLSTAIAEMEFLFQTTHADLALIDQLLLETRFSEVERPHVKNVNLHGMFKGFIDLSFEHNGKYYVLDYKSNYLGESDQDYTQEKMQDAIAEHRYDLQYVIYLVALHKLVKNRIANYSYEEHIGGAIYYFLRGVNAKSSGIFYVKPPFSLIQRVDNIMRGLENNKAKDIDTKESAK